MAVSEADVTDAEEAHMAQIWITASQLRHAVVHGHATRSYLRTCRRLSDARASGYLRIRTWQ